MKASLSGLKNRFAPKSRWGAVDLAPRRTNHGGVSWANAEDIGQPQDGASDARSAVEVLPSTVLREQIGAVHAKFDEPEDAGLTGGTRSLGRRLLGLNIPRPKQAVRQGAAQRAGVVSGQTQIA